MEPSGTFFDTINDSEEELEDLDWEAAFPKDNEDKDAN